MGAPCWSKGRIAEPLEPLLDFVGIDVGLYVDHVGSGLKVCVMEPRWNHFPITPIARRGRHAIEWE